ncbi:MAG TPA: phosphoadenosine phosphosulfate reductase family protein [Parapedobacter sp.]|uniref:phosphoadenosine phosphosulfate reductase domain-containing protein n=1 Tax=Parapedobacter sp. TaxID=1958893 RepID=UPI002CBD16AB|nr:phosphoadenosine phosphosulfate reductase family protein [Parapedobacter sp.]HWK58131.1 phosphoadenosine phosphosulfate reductase family protein [Parapedobacter sp.]
MKGYDKYIVAFSGGKDSISCFLHLLDIGIPKDKIELWHHDIDGREETFMDWEVTPDYCRKFAAAFGVPLYFSWKKGGFKREMLRENAYTQPNYFELPDGSIGVSKRGTRATKATRQKFPQISVDLSVRWCSSYLKIDVMTTAIRNQGRFLQRKVLVISGERGEESKARAAYEIHEPDRADLREGKKNWRIVDRWRPIRDWKEGRVWDIIERYRVRVHPCYYLGWSRCSCKFCIFGNADQFASAYTISPNQGDEIMMYEDSFGVTIKRNMTLRDLIALGRPYNDITPELARMATSQVYDQQIIFNDNEEWILPAGAYGESCGPM